MTDRMSAALQLSAQDILLCEFEARLAGSEMTGPDVKFGGRSPEAHIARGRDCRKAFLVGQRELVGSASVPPVVKSPARV